jgi:hypothetical protein
LNAAQLAKHIPDNRMAADRFRGDPFCRDIIQPPTGSNAPVAREDLIPLQIIGTSVLNFSPARCGIHLQLPANIITDLL